MNALEDFRKSRVKRKKLLRRAATLDSSSAGDVDGSRDSTVVDERDEDMDMLCGTEDFPGKLQVRVCPSLWSGAIYNAFLGQNIGYVAAGRSWAVVEQWAIRRRSSRGTLRGVVSWG